MKRLLSTLAIAVVAAALGIVVATHDSGAAAAGASARPENNTDVPRPQTIEDVLRAELGDERLAQLVQRLSDDQRHSLRDLVHPGDVRPWAEVEPLMRNDAREAMQQSREGWVAFLRDKEADLDPDGRALNPEQKRLSYRDRLLINVIAHSYRPQLEALAQQSFDLAVEADERMWDEHRYRLSLFLDVDPNPARQREAELIHTRVYRNGPWIVTLVLDSSEWKELGAVLEAMKEVRQEREVKVAHYIQER